MSTLEDINEGLSVNVAFFIYDQYNLILMVWPHASNQFQIKQVENPFKAL